MMFHALITRFASILSRFGPLIFTRLRLRAMLALLLLAATTCLADVVTLKDGRTLTGPVTDYGEMIAVKVGGKVLAVAKNDVEHIDRHGDSKELAELNQAVFGGELRDALDNTNAQACLDLANWAHQRGMDREYAWALRAALLISPNNQLAQQQLNTFKSQMAVLPIHYDARRLLLDQFPGYQLYRTNHYRLCYNSNDLYAETTAELLELVYHEFMQFFEDRGFEPAPLTDRMEVVLFDNRTDYRAHVSQHQPRMHHSGGYYATRDNRAYFYDAVNQREYRSAHKRLTETRQRLAEFRHTVLASPDGSQFVVNGPNGQQITDKYQTLTSIGLEQQKLTQQETRLRRHYRNSNISVTVHEATHQLAYECGIHSRYFDTPLWLLEGLATFFEAPRYQWWEGPGHVHRDRLEAFCNAGPATRIPLQRLLTQDDLFELDGGNAAQAYASAWSLFFYLSWQRHEAFFDYLYDLSLRISDEPYAPRERLDDFQRYFGSIERLESDWRAVMNSLL